MEQDPTTTDPDAYRVIFENDRIRVLEYRDSPGYQTQPHGHPDSVMYTLSNFSRRLGGGGKEVDVELAAGTVRWISAQEHYGHNIGSTDSHAIFIELKEPAPGEQGPDRRLGPSAS